MFQLEFLMPLEISQVHLEEFLVRLMDLLVQLDRGPGGLFIGVPEVVATESKKLIQMKSGIKLKILDSVIIDNS